MFFKVRFLKNLLKRGENMSFYMLPTHSQKVNGVRYF